MSAQRQRVGGGSASRVLLAAVFVAFVLIASPASPAFAEPRPVIEPPRIALGDPVEAGGQRTLPAITVTNAGDVAGTFVVEFRSVVDPAVTPAEAAWLRVWPAEFQLAPGEVREVLVTVAPSAETAAQPYRTLLTATTPDGAIAVATTLEFEVVPAAARSGLLTSPILYAVIAGLAALAVALVILTRRFQIDAGALRGRRMTPATAGEPSRSVLLTPPPELREEPVAPPVAEPAGRRWMSEFTEPAFEVPSRPSIGHPALPLAQMPSRRSDEAVQATLPPPLQPSMPPPAVEAADAETSRRVVADRAVTRSSSTSRLTLAGLVLGSALAVWATVATVMLATRPSVDRTAIDAQIAGLEAQVEALTAQVGPAAGETPPVTVQEQGTSTPEAGAPPAESPESPVGALDSESTPDDGASSGAPESEPVVTETPEPTPPTTSQAVETEQPAPPEPEATVAAGGDTWSLGPSGERIYFAGPGGGPLDTQGQDLYDCHHFETWAQALAVREASGPGDPNLIDTDGNGLPCEGLMESEQAG